MPFRRCAGILRAALMAVALGAAGTVEAEEGVPQLGHHNLAETLRALGYTPTDLGGDAYEVTAGVPETDCRIRVALGQDESLLWIYAYFGELETPDALGSAQLMELLTANETYGPTYFSIASDGDRPRWLYLNRVLVNRDMETGRLGLAIEDLCRTVGDIAASWSADAE